ncbi:hypothetical protein [Xanthomonas oryzae]|uniref:Uncharacterized protein n=1 Tax=Xanthomonas oryzae pv. oryzicola (strain BLS256) TaxID=383407 RepID=G7THG7_XANOB|nr:hypothetical protein [Xanthomonas oryzae]AEQ96751.1 hypothetical protein XOC_2641 [Xanthomonas oryzae pv. oryzicola BLS256]MEC5078373.1 hypothetical protein [Xanthomonas oryzae pv. oryzicola]MEC5112203.1 hypothetical protein [Xanthomonas oryzae pv. oryzicola]QEO97231.1 hypothetical protein XOCgx_2239 [Xanthomonas oryzae pv. oryzicola]QGH65971.1 hypothetical protein GHV42_09955 [Xanthomonas oryzae pv. oryzicola]
MMTITATDEFIAWLRKLRDTQTKDIKKAQALAAGLWAGEHSISESPT